MLHQIGDDQNGLAGAIWFARAGWPGGAVGRGAAVGREGLSAAGPAAARGSAPSTAKWQAATCRRPDRHQGRLVRHTLGRHRAAWRESAARPVADAGRRQPADRGQPVLAVLEQRKRGQQASGVRHPRLGEDRVDPAHLDCLARVHHQYAVGDAGHDAKVVTDHDHRGVRLPLDGLQQVEYLRLDGDVQRRGRLVRDQQFGLVCDRHRDHDALAHATGQLMREPARDRGRLGQADRIEQFRPPASERRRSCHADAAAGTRRPASRRCTWGSARSSDPGTPWRPGCPAPAASGPRWPAAVPSPSRRTEPVTCARRGSRPEKRQREHCLARAGLADDADRLAWRDRQADSPDRLDEAVLGRDADREVGHLEQRAGREEAVAGGAAACTAPPSSPPSGRFAAPRCRDHGRRRRLAALRSSATVLPSAVSLTRCRYLM